MSIDLEIEAQTTELQSKMLTFLEKEYLPAWMISEKLKALYGTKPVSYMTMPLGQGTQGISIHVNATGFERGYAHTLIRWIAIQVGKRKKVFQDPKRSYRNAIPFFDYDSESMPIETDQFDEFGLPKTPAGGYDFLQELNPEELKAAWKKAEELHGGGLAVPMEVQILLWPKIRDQVLVPLRNEMERLDKAWKALKEPV